ncbi:hypothetical protein SAMN05216578_1162 [Halopseudomonas formosensis]|uniref:Uncharacterized protein n=1 Tax=Halopseudomonas formosensis TaxID=1002526 RepID=A0A1I6C7Q5_9GAMM|nr:hypothetical protein SAMN05216578_1162 [Halopseudomonas formosensis]
MKKSRFTETQIVSILKHVMTQRNLHTQAANCW